jgi:hypothetical protein
MDRTQHQAAIVVTNISNTPPISDDRNLWIWGKDECLRVSDGQNHFWTQPEAYELLASNRILRDEKSSSHPIRLCHLLLPDTSALTGDEEWAPEKPLGLIAPIGLNRVFDVIREAQLRKKALKRINATRNNHRPIQLFFRIWFATHTHGEFSRGADIVLTFDELRLMVGWHFGQNVPPSEPGDEDWFVEIRPFDTDDADDIPSIPIHAFFPMFVPR